MSKYLNHYVLLVVLLATAAAAIVPVAEFYDKPWLVSYLCALAFLAGVARVRIPALGTHMSAVDPLVFCALAVIGPLGACATGVSAVLGAAIRSGKTMRPIQTVFNLGNVFLTIACAGYLFAMLGGEAGSGIAGLLTPLGVAAVVYFAVNSMLTSIVISLAGKPGGVFANWRRSFLWSIPAYLGGLVLGVAIYVAILANLAWSAAFAVVACWLVMRFFEAHANQTDSTKVAA